MIIPVNRLVVKMGLQRTQHILFFDCVRAKRVAALAAIMGALALACVRPLAADDQPQPEPPKSDRTVPSFWDPQVRPEKPPGDAGSIRFLTSGDFPPFNFLDSGGHLTGFNVDLARAICSVLSANCTIQMRPFGDLANAVTDKRGDAIIAGLKISTELADKLDTTAPYLATPGRFVAPVGSRLAATPEGLTGRWISVVTGSAHEAYVLSYFAGSRVVAYPTEQAARDALRDGTVDAYFGDAIASSFWLMRDSSRKCCAFLGGPYLDTGHFGNGFTIAFQRGNRRLKRELEFALQRLAENGTYRELYYRYFPLGFF